MKQLIYTPCVLAALASSTPALAVDGATLINQATVRAAGGFPCVISQAESYWLAGHVVGVSGTAINTAVQSVTLDVNRFLDGFGKIGIEAATLNLSDSSSVSSLALVDGIVINSSGLISGNIISVRRNGIRVPAGADTALTNNVISGAGSVVAASGKVLIGFNTFPGNQNHLPGTGFVPQKNIVCSIGSGC